MQSFTREQLVKAMQKYQQDIIENPIDYIARDDLDGSLEQAEDTIDNLIYFIDNQDAT